MFYDLPEALGRMHGLGDIACERVARTHYLAIILFLDPNVKQKFYKFFNFQNDSPERDFANALFRIQCKSTYCITSVELVDEIQILFTLHFKIFATI